MTKALERILHILRARSLTWQLTLLCAVSSLTVLFVATLFLYWSLNRSVLFQDKKSALTKAEIVRSLIRREGGWQELRYRIENEWPSRIEEVFHVRFLDSHRRLIAGSPRSEDIFSHVNGTPEGPVLFYYHRTPYRYYEIVIENANSKYLFQIAIDCSHGEALLREYRRRLAMVLMLGLLVCILVAHKVARSALAPVREIGAVAARITSSNLDEKICTEALPSELGDVANSFNAMLDRLKTAFERQQQFSADIAHEIRTPINNISGELQVALAKERSVGFYQDAMGSALEECERISRIIDSLLFIAQSENPKLQVQKEKLLLSTELQAVIDFYEPAATEAGIHCSLEVEPNLFVLAERTMLQRAIGNILSNAIKKTPPNGTIRLLATRRGSDVEIKVIDSGLGIPSKHLPFVFDRFYRVDSSRAQTEGGNGLGLAIVKTIASIHGGDVHVASEVGKGTEVSLILPQGWSVGPGGVSYG